jgi:predicted nucleotidyltransferase
MPTIADIALPEALRDDIDRAVRILREAGCTEVYLFGSIAEGVATERSDIDLAVRGCPAELFLRVYGRLTWDIQRPIDLVPLDSDDPFSQFLQEHGELIRIA